MPNKFTPNKSGATHKRTPKKISRGWKDAQGKRQKTKTTKLALLVFGVIVLLIFFSQVVKFTQMIFHPWKVQSINKAVLWDGKFNINIIIKAKGISLLSFNPSEKKISIIDLPDNVYLESAHGYGSWQLSSIYGLGESQKNLGGVKNLQDTLSNLFGLPIEGVLDFSGKYYQKSSGEIVGELRKSPFSMIGLLSDLKTNLTPYEVMKLNLQFSSVRFDKVKQVDLFAVLDLLQKDQLSDGTDILIVDTIKLDSALPNIIDSNIADERKTIAIFNATDHPGLAQKAARIITNIGGDVIITSNSEKLFKNTQIAGPKSKTLDRLKQIFSLSGIIDSTDKDLVSSRAEINLFLGEDYFEQL